MLQIPELGLPIDAQTTAVQVFLYGGSLLTCRTGHCVFPYGLKSVPTHRHLCDRRAANREGGDMYLTVYFVFLMF